MDLNTKRRHDPQPWGDGEIDSIYVDPTDRFVVSLIVGYAEGDIDTDEYPNTPKGALAAAIDLTRDWGSGDTSWFVYDRATGIMHQFEQDDVEKLTRYDS